MFLVLNFDLTVLSRSLTYSMGIGLALLFGTVALRLTLILAQIMRWSDPRLSVLYARQFCKELTYLTLKIICSSWAFAPPACRNVHFLPNLCGNLERERGMDWSIHTGSHGWVSDVAIGADARVHAARYNDDVVSR